MRGREGRGKEGSGGRKEGREGGEGRKERNRQWEGQPPRPGFLNPGTEGSRALFPASCVWQEVAEKARMNASFITPGIVSEVVGPKVTPFSIFLGWVGGLQQ